MPYRSLSSAHRQTEFQLAETWRYLSLLPAALFCQNRFMNGLSNALGERELLDRVTTIGFIAAIALWFLGQISSNAAEANPLKPPANGSIPVAFLISEGAVVIDFCGP